MNSDYPIDVYVSIYNKISHEKFPINGCWQVSDNSKKAIERLGYNVCVLEEYEHHQPAEHPTECELCDGIGYECCAEYTGYEMRECDGCGKTMCGECNDSCGYCSDPANLKSYYCYKCSNNCDACKETICSYCSDETYLCEKCDTYTHERCKENHECK